MWWTTNTRSRPEANLNMCSREVNRADAFQKAGTPLVSERRREGADVELGFQGTPASSSRLNDHIDAFKECERDAVTPQT